MIGKKTGGRKKGTPNKEKIPLEERAMALGLDVFEVLCYFSKGDWEKLGYENSVYHIEKADGATRMGYVITPDMRLKATTELMQYIYPKKKAVELSTPDEGMKIIIEDYMMKNE